MTPARLRELLPPLGLTERGLARLTGYSHGAVKNWLTGRARVPPEIAAWLERRAADPPPRRAA